MVIFPAQRKIKSKAEILMIIRKVLLYTVPAYAFPSEKHQKLPYLAVSITIMKKTLLLSALAFGAVALAAQNAKTFALPFTSGMMTYVLDKNPWGADQPTSDEIVNGRYTAMYILHHSPTGMNVKHCRTRE